jgi:lysophospholipase L1-like esterase
MVRELESRGPWAALLLLLPMAAFAGGIQRFEFTSGGNAAGYPAYDNSRGFGFEPRASGEPTRFSVKVDEGNYRVTVKFTRTKGPGMTIDAEQRRRLWSVHGQWPEEMSMMVNVRNPDLPALPENAAGGTRVALKPREIGSLSWDDKLTLEISTSPTLLASITVEPVSVPTLYLAGDSTVTDQPVAPSGSWGQYLPYFFDPGMAVANHAESGESLKSFVTELRFAKLLSTLQRGDWVMIQFGHNDQKAQWPQTYADAASTYPAWLRTYLAEIRRRNATPILVTSPERRNFDAQGRITPTLREYADAMRAVAQEQHVALIDLNAMSVRFYEALGPEASPKAFADEGRDKTHHNTYGAATLAQFVIEGLRTADPDLTAGLEKHLRSDIPHVDPTHPPQP